MQYQDQLAIVANLNRIYETESGMISKLAVDAFMKEATWVEFAKHFTPEDLIATLQYLRREIKRGTRKPNCLRLSTLIGQLSNFEAELSLAREDKLRFKPPKTDRQSVVEQTGRAPDNVVQIPKAIGPTVEKLVADLRASVDL